MHTCRWSHTLANAHTHTLSLFLSGTSSEKLRKALGIMNSPDYPPYIYRMRELGYPIGYKLLARERPLQMYDTANGGWAGLAESVRVCSVKLTIVFICTHTHAHTHCR